MISKVEFVQLMNDLSDKRQNWDKLQEAAELLSPGEYINFWPYFSYEDEIRLLLNNMFGYSEKDDSPIDWFMVEGDFGKNKEALVYFVDNTKIDISTPQKLYNVIVKNVK